MCYIVCPTPCVILGIRPSNTSCIRYDRQVFLELRSLVSLNFADSVMDYLPLILCLPVRRKKTKRGKRAGILCNKRPPLPTILLANIQAINNKLDDLRANGPPGAAVVWPSQRHGWKKAFRTMPSPWIIIPSIGMAEPRTQASPREGGVLHG